MAEVAAARAPAVVVADPRPFREQHHTVRAVRDAGIAVGVDAWPDPSRWPDLLREAVRLGGGAGAAGRTATGPPARRGSLDDLASGTREPVRDAVLGA